MRPFYLILSTYGDGEVGSSDPQWSLDDAADEFLEAEKLGPVSRKVVMIDGITGITRNVTGRVSMLIRARTIEEDAA